ncbi:hypothetical protein [Mycolicibacterium stellerae]|uniref:hypothetical protein n=1 Tax=Mycolicibacterium stellerae TaxID=2358193 RepID=UPI000F0B61B3|nr:hypothetical protein [Mycolicibacterium stellerae]
MSQPTPPAQPTPSPNPLFEKFSKQLKDHISKAGVMAVKAAEAADADKFGIDARITVAHEFVDLEVKGHAELLETLIAGPWVTPVVIGPSDNSALINVPKATAPRTVEIKTNFVRVGWKDMQLKPEQLNVSPLVLAAGATEVTITLLDPNFAGANYRGRVKLTTAGPTGATNAASTEDVVVTVGL